MKEAVRWYRKAAEQGYARAQFNLGLRYDHGQGVPQDVGQAMSWYRKAAEQNLPAAQHNLALCYELGTGVAVSRVRLRNRPKVSVPPERETPGISAMAWPNGMLVSGMSLYSWIELNTGVPNDTWVNSPASEMWARTARAASAR